MSAPNAQMKRARTKPRPFPRVGSGPIELLELDASAGLFELALELVGLVALDAFLDRLRSLVDERLGLLQTEAGRRTDDLDDLDLLVAGSREDDVDRRGLLLGCCAIAAAARGRSRGCDCRRRHAELLLERPDALGELCDRDALELFDPILGAGCHQLSPSSFEVSVESPASAAGSGIGWLGISSAASGCGASSGAVGAASPSAASAALVASGASESAGGGAAASAAGASASAAGASASAAGASSPSFAGASAASAEAA